MRKNVLFLMCLVFVGMSQAALYQHLDASKADSVVLGTVIKDPVDPNIIIGYAVSQWLDQSGKGNNASTYVGNVLYPSANELAGGFPSVRFGGSNPLAPVRSGLTLFSDVAQDSFLNFAAGGAAATKTGFCAMIAFRQDALSSGGWTDMFGNTSTTAAGFTMRHGSGVQIILNGALGGIGTTLNSGETQVWTLNYDKAAGTVYFWDSKNKTTYTVAKAAADFSQNRGFTIGSISNASRYMIGQIGEIKIYDNVLSPADFAYQQDMLTRKWATNRAVAPADGSEVIAANPIALQWINLLPETQGDNVYVDVYFGTEPNLLTMTKVVNNGLGTTTVNVNASTVDEYYWAVNTSFGYAAADDDPNLIQGPIYSFGALADPSPQSVDAGPNFATWPNQGVPVNATVSDGGVAPITVTFTSSDPNLTFSPNPVVISGGGVPASQVTASTTATCAQGVAAPITVTATAEDSANPGVTVSDTMTITVYASACQTARIAGNQAANYPEDIVVGDPYPLGSGCIIDFADFAAIAAKWLDNYAATAPIQLP
jgi:hypothetical protein